MLQGGRPLGKIAQEATLLKIDTSDMKTHRTFEILII